MVVALGPGGHVAAPLRADAAALERFEFTEPHMGTRVRLVLYASQEDTATRAARRAFDRVAGLDAALSDYRSDSELNEVCRVAAAAPVEVSDDLLRVLVHAQALAHETGGAFDVTSAPVVQLWRRAHRQAALPDAARLQEALERSGYDRLVVDPATRRVRLARGDMRLDLGGIAKGYAADRAAGVLRAAGVARALVAVGGDIVTLSGPPDRPGWRVAIGGDARLNRGDAILIENAAVSTSGDAERWTEIGGVRYSHIIDPRTGAALTERRQVTVVAGDGITADSLATALSVLSPEEGLALAERTPGAAALIVREDPRGQRQVHRSGRWNRWAASGS
jgi:FAD:protein FMN transferase